MKQQKAVSKSSVVKQSGKTAKAAVAAPASNTLRKRVGNVRGLILGLLESGPMSSPALVAQGGFSPASVFLNMKSLKQEGVVSAARNGREVLFSLTGAPTSSGTSAKSAKEKTLKVRLPKPAASPRATVLAYVPSELHDALNGLTRQLSPIEALVEKLRVLDVLSQTLPPPITSVLVAIAADLQRMSSADAPVPF